MELRIENAALRKETDEANASAVDFAEQANVLHREKEQIELKLKIKSEELNEFVKLVRGLTVELGKLNEEAAAKKRADNRVEKEKLLQILAEKQAGQLSALSEKEIQKRIAALDT